ncbi:hypothetical protein [Streptomyces sp. ST2-7A]|uniref:hypothetical protein n=1 Tax=Streptomyces sp. ST2-7A TaxID=2907214 RepID=UPI001F353CD2|nr:hypothetical protein [Streptomyces sp. ST2-7A]MCE7080591.1 hypothetical protein [Streptomyces sp. ST2-7A]
MTDRVQLLMEYPSPWFEFPLDPDIDPDRWADAKAEELALAAEGEDVPEITGILRPNASALSAELRSRVSEYRRSAPTRALGCYPPGVDTSDVGMEISWLSPDDGSEQPEARSLLDAEGFVDLGRFAERVAVHELGDPLMESAGKTGTGVVPVPEPALRPAARGRGARGAARRARIFLRPGELVARNGRGGETRVPVGPKGVTRAVMIAEPERRTGDGSVYEPLGRPGSRGTLLLLDITGRCRARLRVDDWLPESDLLPASAPLGEAMAERTGFTALCEAAGLPLKVVPNIHHRDLSEAGGDAAPVLSPATGVFPGWYRVTRCTGALVWFVCFALGTFAGPTAFTALVAALAALSAPIARLVLRGVVTVRERRIPALVDSISPAPRSGVSRRFLRTARVGADGQDLVIVDGVGHTHRFALRGPLAIRRLVRVTGSADGTPARLEFRDSGDRTRAALPEQDWFSGPEGSERRERLRRLLGVPIVHEETHRSGRPGARVGEADRTRRDAGAAFASALAQPGAGAARRGSAFPRTIAGPSSSIFLVLSPAFAMIFAFSARGEDGALDTMAGTALGVAIAAWVLAALPPLHHLLGSVLWWERPASAASSPREAPGGRGNAGRR